MSKFIHTKELQTSIRVALIIERGCLRPVWFEEIDKPGRDRVYIKEISYKWVHMEGAAKILNFAVWDAVNSYCLSLNTLDFTWRLGIAEEYQFPHYQPFLTK